MLRIIAVSSGAVDYLLRGSGCAGHEHAPDFDAGHSVERAVEHAHQHEQTVERGRGGAARYFGAAVGER